MYIFPSSFYTKLFNAPKFLLHIFLFLFSFSLLSFKFSAISARTLSSLGFNIPSHYTFFNPFFLPHIFTCHLIITFCRQSPFFFIATSALFYAQFFFLHTRFRPAAYIIHLIRWIFHPHYLTHSIRQIFQTFSFLHVQSAILYNMWPCIY